MPVTAALALVCAAAAAAATFLAIAAAGIAPVRDDDLPPEQRVVAGSGRLLDLRAGDPYDAAARWGLRIARSSTGFLCSTVGQVVDGRLGIVGLDGRFRALPEANADACGQESRRGVSLLGTRIFDAKRYRDVRTVISGVAGPGLRSVTVALRGGRPRAVPHSPEGAFVLAVAGYPEDVAARVTFTWSDGRTRTEPLATSHDVVTDPLGGPAWRIGGGIFGSGRNLRTVRRNGRTVRVPRYTCASFSSARTLPRYAQSPPLCGVSRYGPSRRDPTRYYATRRLSGDSEPGRTLFRTGDWNGRPARTAVWGNVGTLVRRVIATAPGGIRGEAKLPRWGGSFVIVLPPAVDPARVRIALERRDGRVERTGPNVGLVAVRRATR